LFSVLVFPPDATAGSFSARRDRRELFPPDATAGSFFRPTRPQGAFSARRDRRELRSEKGFACAKYRGTRCSRRSDRNFASLRVGRNGALFPPDATAGSFGRKKVSLAQSEGSPAAPAVPTETSLRCVSGGTARFSARRDRRELRSEKGFACAQRRVTRCSRRSDRNFASLRVGRNGAFFRPTRPQGASVGKRFRLRKAQGHPLLLPFRPKLRFAACRAERRVFSARRDRRELRSEKGFACAKCRVTRCSGRSDRNFASLRVGRNGAFFPPDATAGSFGRKKVSLAPNAGSPAAPAVPTETSLRCVSGGTARFSARRDRRELRSEKGFACAKHRGTRCSCRSDRNFALLRVGRNGAFFPPDATAGSFGRKKVSLAPNTGSPAAPAVPTETSLRCVSGGTARFFRPTRPQGASVGKRFRLRQIQAHPLLPPFRPKLRFAACRAERRVFPPDATAGSFGRKKVWLAPSEGSPAAPAVPTETSLRCVSGGTARFFRPTRPQGASVGKRFRLRKAKGHPLLRPFRPKLRFAACRAERRVFSARRDRRELRAEKGFACAQRRVTRCSRRSDRNFASLRVGRNGAFFPPDATAGSFGRKKVSLAPNTGSPAAPAVPTETSLRCVSGGTARFFRPTRPQGASGGKRFRLRPAKGHPLLPPFRPKLRFAACRAERRVFPPDATAGSFGRKKVSLAPSAGAPAASVGKRLRLRPAKGHPLLRPFRPKLRFAACRAERRVFSAQNSASTLWFL
jgi:hypothetical protein